MGYGLRSLMAGCVVMLIGTALAETPVPYSTLPRPAQPVRFDQPTPEPLPTPLPRPETPLIAPIDGPGAGLPLDSIPGAAPPFRQRIRADLVEVGLLFPSLSQDLNAQVDVPGVGIFDARLPSASIGVTTPFIVHLQFNLWRYGELDLGYRLLIGEATEILGGFDPDGPAILRSRVNMNTFDVNYASSGFGRLWNLLWFVNDDPIRPRWGLRWDLGARLASFFYDTTAIGPTRERHISSYFFGGGPRVGLTVTRQIGDLGFNAFGRVDLGALMGTVNQQFSQLESAGGVPIGFGYTAREAFQTVPTLRVEAGLGGVTPFLRGGRWQVAYQFEDWFSIATAGGSTGDFITHGVMFRWTRTY